MVRSRRVYSRESLVADSGISIVTVGEVTSTLNEQEEEALLDKLCVTDFEDEDSDDVDYNPAVKRGTKRKSSKHYENSNSSSSPDEDVNAKLELSLSPSTSAFSTTSSASSTFKQPTTTTTPKRQRVSHICDICQKEFGGKTDLKRHILIHSNERPHKCAQCGKRFRQAVNLKNHITTTHEGKRQFSCALCGKLFALKERLRLHMRIHSGEKPYSCNLCDKSFARGGQLKQHQISHHKSSIKQYICEKCSASFSSRTNLRVHMERHEQGPDHFCEICKEHFQNEVILRAHVNKVHYKLKEFECEVCKKTTNDLSSHMKSHSHIKMHICEVCNAYFAQKSQYNVHMRMHTGERPYQCQICWQTFAYSSVLKLHIRKHTGEKPFNCQLCTDDVAFSQLAHLKTHMNRIHNQEKAYMCETCNKFFKVKAELQTHIQMCNSADNAAEDNNDTDKDKQTLSHMRFLIALLLKKISSEERLKKLGYEKRLIDNVVIASLKLAGRKFYDDSTLSTIERLRLNVNEFLSWIVPANVIEDFRSEQVPVECVLEKIVTSYLKQK